MSSPKGIRYKTKVQSAQPFLGPTEVTSLEQKDGTIHLVAKTGDEENPFVGKPAEGKPDQILGAFRFRGDVYPARLEKTDAKEVGQPKPGELPRKLIALRQVDAKERVQKLQDMIHENAGDPNNYLPYTMLLQTASEADLAADKVSEIVKTWIDQAESHGPMWVNAVRAKALKALAGKKTYAPISLDLAKAADKNLSESASTEQKAEIVGLLATAAEQAGDDLLASQARERSEKLEAVLDEEYHEKVPPFEPKPYEGKATRVVLMELFTGAQCPPCVAADVGFDALLESYKTSQVIGLQYHLHIPGPDPLDEPDVHGPV